MDSDKLLDRLEEEREEREAQEALAVRYGGMGAAFTQQYLTHSAAERAWRRAIEIVKDFAPH